MMINGIKIKGDKEKGLEILEKVLGKEKEVDRKEFLKELKKELKEYIMDELEKEKGLVNFRRLKMRKDREITTRWIRKVRSLLTEFIIGERDKGIGLDELIEEVRYLIFYGRRIGESKDRFQYEDYERFYKGTLRLNLRSKRGGRYVFWLVTNEKELELVVDMVVSEFIEWQVYGSTIYTTDYVGLKDEDREWLRYFVRKMKEREKISGGSSVNVKSYLNVEISNEKVDEWEIIKMLEYIDIKRLRGEYYRNELRWLERRIRSLMYEFERKEDEIELEVGNAEIGKRLQEMIEKMNDGKCVLRRREKSDYFVEGTRSEFEERIERIMKECIKMTEHKWKVNVC